MTNETRETQWNCIERGNVTGRQTTNLEGTLGENGESVILGDLQ